VTDVESTAAETAVEGGETATMAGSGEVVTAGIATTLGGTVDSRLVGPVVQPDITTAQTIVDAMTTRRVELVAGQAQG